MPAAEFPIPASVFIFDYLYLFLGYNMKPAVY